MLLPESRLLSIGGLEPGPGAAENPQRAVFRQPVFSYENNKGLIMAFGRILTFFKDIANMEGDIADISFAIINCDGNLSKLLGFTLDCSISKSALVGRWTIVFDITGFRAIAKTPRATYLG